MGLTDHHRPIPSSTDVWITPKYIIDDLGPFDLDPCTPEVQPWPTGSTRFYLPTDGLRQPWRGRVWCNPPYGRETGKWLAKCAEHGNAMALIFARTDTKMFSEYVWRRADALLFLEGRVTFCLSDGTPAPANSGAPSVVVAYGAENAALLALSGLPGAYVPLNNAQRNNPENRA